MPWQRASDDVSPIVFELLRNYVRPWQLASHVVSLFRESPAATMLCMRLDGEIVDTIKTFFLVEFVT